MKTSFGKVSIIGAGNVGSLTAMRLLESGLCDVALLDIIEGLAKGKAEDLMDAASIIGHGRELIGSTDFSLMKDSAVVVITAGFPRKPGMTREELLAKNAGIIKSVSEKIAQYAPDSIIINVTNPLDAMTFAAYKYSGFKPEKVVGMAGLLDSSRMNLAVSRVLDKPLNKIDSLVLGTHGETMAPVLSQSKIENKPATQSLENTQQEEVIDKTKKRGAEIVSYLKTGSAYFSPSACAAKMVEIILKGKKQTIPASCFLKGEYGIDGIYLGVPAVLGKTGVEKILELKLTNEELATLRRAAESIKNSIKKIA